MASRATDGAGGTGTGWKSGGVLQRVGAGPDGEADAGAPGMAKASCP